MASRNVVFRLVCPLRLTAIVAILVEAPVCIVTGGARGIGRAIAEMLGATGAKVTCASCSWFTPHNLHCNIAEHCYDLLRTA